MALSLYGEDPDGCEPRRSHPDYIRIAQVSLEMRTRGALGSIYRASLHPAENQYIIRCVWNFRDRSPEID